MQDLTMERITNKDLKTSNQQVLYCSVNIDVNITFAIFCDALYQNEVRSRTLLAEANCELLSASIAQVC